MRNFAKIGVIIGLGVLLSGCSLLPKSGGNVSSQTTGQEKKTETTAPGKSFDGTLKAAITLGVPMKCTYKVGDNETTGIIKGKQWRGDFKQNGKEGTVIIKDTCMWSWTKGEAQGLKMCFEPKEGKDIWDEAGQVDSNVEYHCLPTLVTDADFNPPAEVKFSTLEEMMQKATQPSGQDTGGE